jgi:hypothetical protein
VEQKLQKSSLLIKRGKMQVYSLIVTIHVFFASLWLVNFIVDFIFRKKMFEKGELIPVYLSFSNLLGIISSMGILVTGIFIVTDNPGYQFFQLNGNHWLTTKQIIFVFLLLLIFIGIIPAAKKVKKSFMEEQPEVGVKTEESLKKLLKLTFLMNIMVLINFLLGLSGRFFTN